MFYGTFSLCIKDIEFGESICFSVQAELGLWSMASGWSWSTTEWDYRGSFVLGKIDALKIKRLIILMFKYPLFSIRLMCIHSLVFTQLRPSSIHVCSYGLSDIVLFELSGRYP